MEVIVEKMVNQANCMEGRGDYVEAARSVDEVNGGDSERVRREPDSLGDSFIHHQSVAEHLCPPETSRRRGNIDTLGVEDPGQRAQMRGTLWQSSG